MHLRMTLEAQAVSSMGTHARSGIGLGVAAAIVASVFSLPIWADSSSCGSSTPGSTGCSVVDASFTNMSQDLFAGTSYSGTFGADNDLQVFQISVTIPNDFLTIQSRS